MWIADFDVRRMSGGREEGMGGVIVGLEDFVLFDGDGPDGFLLVDSLVLDGGCLFVFGCEVFGLMIWNTFFLFEGK